MIEIKDLANQAANIKARIEVLMLDVKVSANIEVKDTAYIMSRLNKAWNSIDSAEFEFNYLTSKDKLEKNLPQTEFQDLDFSLNHPMVSNPKE